MPSQFFGLNIAYTGLTTANAGLNTVANNIANVETEGYSRQSAVQEATKAIRTFTTYGSAGSGVDTIAIERMRDEFYDDKFWDNREKLGEMEVKAYYMKSIENYFTDTETTAGFNTSFNLMYNALEELAKNAGDTSTKSQFVNYAQSLCDYFNSGATSLSELQKDVNMEINDVVARINSIAEQVASLNKQINVIELTKVNANELRDKRTLLLDELSQYVSIETIETPIYDTANSYDTGANRFMVKIAGGQVLVDTNEYWTLECVARENYEKTNQSDCDGLYDLVWSNGNSFSMYSPVIGGKLQGLIELRDGNNTENFRGTVSEVDTANNKIKVEVFEDYLKDINKCTLSDTGGKISLGAEVYYYTDWKMTLDTTTGECIYEFQLDASHGECTLSNSRKGANVMVGKDIKYQGIPYYQEQLNEFVRQYATTFNNILTQPGATDGHGNTATEPDLTDPTRVNNVAIMFAGNKAVGDQYLFEDSIRANEEIAAGYSTIFEYGTDSASYYNLTAANLSVNEKLITDSEFLATRTGASAGESKADVVNELINMKTDKEVMKFRGGSASEFLQSILSDVALNANRANSSQSYYDTMSRTIDNQRLSISGVDSDEEAIDLVRYQNSYNVASKMIQTFTEIYDRLILQTGV